MSDFGDHVRVKETPETIAAGVAAMEGDVRGFTTSSVTGVTVIGGAPDDYAINVFVTQLDADRWIRPDLVEFLHHNAGFTISVGNVRAVRQPDGSWVETRIAAPPATAPQPTSWLDRMRKWFQR